MQIELLKFRHVFIGDDHAGVFDGPAFTVRLREEFSEHAGAVKAFFAGRMGIILREVIVGFTAASKLPPPPPEFPHEIAAVMQAGLGKMTPSALEWARRNWDRETFDRCYQGEATYDDTPGEVVTGPPAESTPEPARVKRAYNRKPKA